ncbi:hypothetical protein [Pseudonocardia sp. WMMC193]|uniref:hypothetical protein n=1 Tax=Pseudonocardia sp. WMMC193 TaxID=2911965 RepID=UPI001F1CDAED|nr:hypothetical protein [Pseudonocardia sp. WMMC193]MCF7552558.1 hypothetical protein [Pseudonocardia sp. WMMC193]
MTWRERLRLPPSKTRDHLATFSSGAISYSFTFDVGTRVSHVELASRLLEADIAEAGRTSMSNDIPLGRRFRRLTALKRHAMGLRYIYDLTLGRQPDSEVPAPSRWIAFFRVMWMVLLDRIPRRHKKEAAEQAPSTSSAEKLDEATQLLDSQVTNLRALLLARAAVDADIYRASYLSDAPFVRLSLPALRLAGFERPLVASEPDEPVEVELLLHQSGVAILTFHLIYPHGLNSDELSLISRSSRVKFSTCGVPVRIVGAFCKGQSESFAKFASNVRSEDGEPDRVYTELATAIALDDIFEIYQGAIFLHSAEPRHHVWFCHPTIFVEGLLCCNNSKTWLTTHAGEKTAILSGAPVPQMKSFREDNLSFRDFGLTFDSSFFVTGGLAVDIAWDFGQSHPPEATAMFLRLAVIENALIQYWQITILEASIDSVRASRGALAKAKAELSFGMTEIDKPQLSYGTANEIAQHAFDAMGGPAIHKSAISKLSALDDLLSAERTYSTNRRSARLATGAILGAVLLGLPALRQSLDILRSVPALRSAGSTVLSLFPAASLDSLATILYLCFLVLTFLIAISGRVKGRGLRRIALSPLRGEHWERPGSIESIDLVENRPHSRGDEAPEPQTQKRDSD